MVVGIVKSTALPSGITRLSTHTHRERQRDGERMAKKIRVVVVE